MREGRMSEVIGEMEKLMAECLFCRRCGVGGCLLEGKLSNVFSNMNCDARVMVVGQNPGMDEVRRGEPFVGVAGRFFDEALAEAGMSRADFYVSNAVRCYAPGNRKPLQEELDNCRYFLDREIEILKPVMAVALGGTALRQLTGMSGITKNRGEAVFSPRYKIFVFPLLHPSPLNASLHGNGAEFAEDLAKLRDAVERAKAGEVVREEVAEVFPGEVVVKAG
jgi:DNA polymerase